MSVAFAFVGLLAAQSGMISNSVGAQPPLITSVPPAPPPPIIAVREGSAQPFVAVPIHVRVAAGNQVLFEDTLRTGRNGASFDQNRSEAPAGPCAPGSGYSYGNRQSLRVQLYLVETGQAGPAVRTSVNWQRPSSTGNCAPEGSRTVAVSEIVPLAPGQSATIRGDGGLAVTLSRP